MDALSGPDDAGRTVNANRGVAWWTEAWALFTREPGMWIVFLLIDVVLTIVLSTFPWVGAALAAMATSLFRGGWMLAADKVQRGEAIDVSDLFAGFARFLQPLAIIGLALFAIDALIDALVGVSGFTPVWPLSSMAMHPPGQMAPLVAGLTGALLSWLLSAAVASLLWFAVPRVVLEGQQPLDAMRSSITAVMRNVGPFLVFGLLGLAAFLVLAPLTLGLALLVLLPLSNLAIYLSWRDVHGPARAAA